MGVNNTPSKYKKWWRLSKRNTQPPPIHGLCYTATLPVACLVAHITKSLTQPNQPKGWCSRYSYTPPNRSTTILCWVRNEDFTNQPQWVCLCDTYASRREGLDTTKNNLVVSSGYENLQKTTHTTSVRTPCHNTQQPIDAVCPNVLRDSNPRPKNYDFFALPTELKTQKVYSWPDLNRCDQSENLAG